MENQNTTLKDRYQLDRLLGRGGMGEVYLAEDTLLSRQVAVKKVLYSGNEYLLRLAQTEAMVLARLRHESLPKILDYFNADQTQYIVMEYVDGQDLGEMLQLNHGPFTLAKVWPWAETLLDVLEYLHNQSPPVVHRDIKPQNIKITGEGKLFLLDFGLVKDTPTRVAGGSLSPSVYGYSQSYAPLEQINGDPTSVQTDVYGLCATLYHLLTNVKPADALDRATKRIERKPDSLRPACEVNPNVPLGVSRVLGQGLQLNGDERIKSVQELRQLLRQERNKSTRIEVNVSHEADGYVSQIAPQPPPTPRPSRFSNRARSALIAAAAVILLSVVSVGGYRLYEGYKAGVEAQRLFAEAQSLERREGLLSPNACAKYSEVVIGDLDQSARDELILKTNSCTNVKLLFQDVEAREKSNGLNYDTAAAYRKIIDGNPGSVFAKQAEKKVSEYERNEQATLRAYKALQKADYKSDIDDTQVTGDMFKKLAGKYFEAINLYGEIDLANVDPILSGHIVNCIDAYKRWRALFTEIEGERVTIINNMEANVSKWGEYWRDYYQKQAAAEFLNVLTTKYAARLKSYEDGMKKLDELDKTYGSQLQTKFNNKGFVDQY
jgi:serine/threonine protein kinase